ncbi:hypothetical protein GGR56DRAFT_655210 [Xylariaceae sp. FL0804]|nr:hypothetical protein GGR56DRAFT_655210 [Xylariaceae sp. FL0804]
MRSLITSTFSHLAFAFLCGAKLSYPSRFHEASERREREMIGESEKTWISTLPNNASHGPWETKAGEREVTKWFLYCFAVPRVILLAFQLFFLYFR